MPDFLSTINIRVISGALEMSLFAMVNVGSGTGSDCSIRSTLYCWAVIFHVEKKSVLECPQPIVVLQIDR